MVDKISALLGEGEEKSTPTLADLEGDGGEEEQDLAPPGPDEAAKKEAGAAVRTALAGTSDVALFDAMSNIMKLAGGASEPDGDEV